MDDGWTLDELVRRATQALAADDVRAPNGRVRDLPDGRAIRWYATIGLVDRPLASRGRVARYGPRHLRQVVAVKRRQAQGRTLAVIQAELAGATDATLAAVARVPAGLLADAPATAAARGGRAAADHPAGTTGSGPEPAEPAGPADPPGRPRFWAVRPAATAGTGAAAPVADRADHAGASGGHRVGGYPYLAGYVLDLGGGVALTLPVAPADDDLDAIAAATTDLLTVLAHRGLRATREGDDR